jgi:hypothetical protein
MQMPHSNSMLGTVPFMASTKNWTRFGFGGIAEANYGK